MKPLQEKRKDALMRAIRRQQTDETKLVELKADLKKMEKAGPHNKVVIDRGVFAGMTIGDQKDSLSRHIEMTQRTVTRREKEIAHLKVLISQGRDRYISN
ncbi:MAG: hypothetical protein ACOYB3_01450 [Azonexus sp.]